MQVDMTKGNPLPIILKFMLPLFVGNVFQQLYNMADTIIVGRYVGASALAAVGSTGTILFLITGLSQGLTTGFTVLTAQCFGAQELRRVRGSVANGIILSVAVAVILTLCFVLGMGPLLRLMNTPDNIYQDAYTCIVLVSWGTGATVFYNLFSSYLRAVGNSQMPLVFLVFSAVLNVGLDLLLIVNFHMGVAGAAIATAASQAISALLCLLYIRLRVPLLWPQAGEWRFSRSAARHQLAVGIPMSLQFAITSSGTMIMQSAINLFGSTAVAAYTAACKLHNVLVQEMPAMGQALSTYCGQNYGKGDLPRIRKGVRSAVLISTIYAVLAAFAGVLLLRPLLPLFFSGETSLAELLPWATTYMRICVLFYIPLSYIFIFRNAMQGCGYGFLPMMGGVVELLARLGAAMIAMHVMSYALAVFCDPAAWLSAGIFTGVAYLFVMKDLRRRQAEGSIGN